MLVILQHDSRGAGTRNGSAMSDAFHNRMAPMFYQPEPAARAWQLAEEFLGRYLPVPGRVSS